MNLALSLFFLLLLRFLLAWRLKQYFWLWELFKLCANKISIIFLLFTYQHWIKFFQLRKYTNNNKSKIVHWSEWISMNCKVFKLFKVWKLSKVIKQINKVTVKVKCFKVGKITKIVIQSHQIIMTEVNPLQLIPIVHYWFYHCRKLLKRSDFIIS